MKGRAMKEAGIACIVLVLSSHFLGCARDRTIDDYKRGRAEQDLARMDAFKGEYLGTLVAPQGEEISVISVRVGSRRVTIPAATGPETEQRAVLTFSVALAGSRSMMLAFNDGAFDYSSQQFKANSAVDDRGALALEGGFDGEVLTGTLEAESYPQRGGTFRLERQSSSLPQLVSGRHMRARREEAFLFSSFSGMGTFHVGPPTQVHMTVLRRTNLQEQDFADLLSPYRTVDVSVYFERVLSDGTKRRVGGVFAGAVWDISGHRLTGDYTAPSAPGQLPTVLHLDCDEVQGGGGESGWSCKELSGGVNAGEIFKAVFMPEPPEVGGKTQ